MAQHDDIRSGLWTTFYDYDRHPLFRRQILLSARESTYWTNFIAVLISLTIPCFLVLLRRAVLAGLTSLGQFVSRIFRTVVNQPDPANGAPPENADAPRQEEHNLLAPILHQLQVPRDEDNSFKAIKKIFSTINGPIQLQGVGPESVGIWPEFVKFLTDVYLALKKMWNDLGLTLAIFFVIAFYLTILGVGFYFSIISANLLDGSVVLSANSHLAGEWEIDQSSAAAILGEGKVIDENRQSRSWSYKRSCYGSDGDSFACNMFYSRQLPVHGFSNASCPFDGDACLFGNQSAFEVTTGLLDSNTLGVNALASKRFHFRKTMSCAPLKSDERYIIPTGNGSSSYPNQWVYDYGDSFNGDFTYRNAREWKLWTGDIDDIPVYSMGLSIYCPVEQIGTFLPRKKFRAGNKTVTLMFISTGGPHLHVFERDDPIFPAHTEEGFYINPETHGYFWYNNSTRAGVLGCVDSYQICTDASESLCWDKTNSSQAMDHFSGDHTRQRALYLVLVSLVHSNAWRILNYQLAAALNATTEVKRFVGIRLAQEQWKVEVENIFAASLAGMQTRVYDYARGTYAHHPSMFDRTPRSLEDNDGNIRAAVSVAKMIKFKNKEYKNISVFGFSGVISLCLLVFLGSRRFSTAERRAQIEKKGNEEARKKAQFYDYLWVTILWEGVVVSFSKTVGGWILSNAVACYNYASRRRRPRSRSRDAESQRDTNGTEIANLAES